MSTNVPQHKGCCVGSDNDKGWVCNSNKNKNSKSEMKVQTEDEWRKTDREQHQLNERRKNNNDLKKKGRIEKERLAKYGEGQ